MENQVRFVTCSSIRASTVSKQGHDFVPKEDSMSDIFDVKKVSIPMGKHTISLETGRLACQADGAVWIQCADTIVLVTAQSQALDREIDFLPLVVNYQEMIYAAGRIPGGYFRREIGRPTDRETLVSRLIDRPIRPLFPEGIGNEIQVIATVLSSDPNQDPDVLAITGASAALQISSIPFQGPIAGARIGYVGGQFVFNPDRDVMEQSKLNLVMAGSRDAVVMVEGGANFLPESTLAEAITWGHTQLQPLLDMQEELMSQAGKPKYQVSVPAKDTELEKLIVAKGRESLSAALRVPEKMARKTAKSKARTDVLESLREQFADQPDRLKQFDMIWEEQEKDIVRKRIVTEKTRIDGRDLTTVRPLKIETGLLPRTHGSALFARGETKALCIATLGSTRDEQRVETLTGEENKRFMLHYNFPPYCVGEVRPLRGPSRREIGHGTLAERALTPVLPDTDDFPFTLRVVSEVMESNGSSSMATVCGSTLSLMDAGVPIKEPVAGIAMGLIKEEGEYLVLTDILGEEDHLGDMDFKVAGTRDGITAIQMDIKIAGIPTEVMSKALAQAKDARLHILDTMQASLEKPREELSRYAPQMDIVYVDTSKIRDVIGPGGKNIKAITAATDASIDIEDDGKVSIFAPTQDSLQRAREMVLFYDQKAEMGKTYDAVVKKLVDFGAFVEILPGVEGLVHVSQLDRGRVQNVTDVVREGDKIKVKVIAIENNGKLRLSRLAVLMEEAGEEFDYEAAQNKGRSGGNGRGGRSDRKK